MTQVLGGGGAQNSAQPFIGEELRPDLSQGGLSGECDCGRLKKQMAGAAARAPPRSWTARMIRPVAFELEINSPAPASAPGMGSSAGLFVILCHVDDDVAAAVGAGLIHRVGPSRVRMVTMEELVLAPSWVHRVGDPSAGGGDCVRLPDGFELRGEGVAVVFNRLRYVYASNFAAAKKVDRDYAASEMHALALSWLDALPCALINRPSPQGLSGRQLSLVAWKLLAMQAGFSVGGKSPLCEQQPAFSA